MHGVRVDALRLVLEARPPRGRSEVTPPKRKGHPHHDWNPPMHGIKIALWRGVEPGVVSRCARCGLYARQVRVATTVYAEGWPAVRNGLAYGWYIRYRSRKPWGRSWYIPACVPRE